ncbi:kelch-like protein 32 isoform X1 [Amphiura filiformis]|uniref:kelch-like protein 32 isoform X1 n=1 Tax=Amphiura filiformis TaxID=82378 RepID=UPI003B2245E9
MVGLGQDQCVKQMGDPSHLSHLSSGLNQLRHHSTFCDVTIIVVDQRFPAHKAVLSCASDYFQGMFSSGFQESTMSEITVPGTEESFAQILNFIYTGHFSLSVRTVTGILKMAGYMVLTKAVELCAEYLKDIRKKLPVEDFFEVWSIASNHNSLSEVALMYRRYVIEDFVKCVNSRVFLENSSASVMMEILSDEEIEADTTTEEQILQGTVTWLKYDWEQREIHAVDLLQKIHLGLVPIDRLKQILGDEIMAIPECMDMVEEVVKLSDIMDTTSPQSMKSHPDLFATRNTITIPVFVTKDDDGELASGLSIGCSTKASCYKLTKLADFPRKFTYQKSDVLINSIGLVFSGAGHLYGGGGKDFPLYGTTPERLESHYKCLSENNFFRYNSEKNVWDVLPPMIKIRHSPLMIQVDECIYSFGFAENDLTMNNVMEKYSFPRNKWEIVKDGLGFTAHNVVKLNGCLLVKGVLSFDAYNRNEEYHSLLHRRHIVKVALYKPAKDKWLEVSCDVGVGKWSYFVEVDNICYLIKNSNQVKRVLCDFESDRPSIMIAETVRKGTDTYRKVRRADQAVDEFTFDKRKLGMIPMPCKCESHAENEVNRDDSEEDP